MPRTRGLAAVTAVLATATGAAFSGCGGGLHHAGAPSLLSAHHQGASTERSNVARDDYAGSATCVPCHRDVASAWSHSPMHRMTRNARNADVRAPFDGRRWSFKGDAVVLETRGDERLVRIESAGGGSRTYRVTRIIGGRTREDFAGVDADRAGEPTDEVVLPVSFVFATGTLRYKGYSVMVHERATLRPGPLWNRTCIFCHNTIPEMDRMLGAIAEAPSRPFQGETVDRWLPNERRASVHVTDAPAFAQIASEEIARMGGRQPDSGAGSRDVAHRAIDAVRAGFDASALVEVGIGCEACHGGGREHASDPAVRTTLVPTAPWLAVGLPNGRAQAINRVCARCHQVLFSGYPFTWEGGRRDSGAGGSHINSGEARDFLLGGCASAMSCTTCHDPHGGSDPQKMRAFDTVAGNAVCTTCHTELGDPERLRAHAHHAPNGAGAACAACHMPRKNMGLDGRLTRYHRIGSPTDPERVLGDRPLECALCHEDRSVRALVETMEAWWPVRYPRQRLEELYGSLDANPMRATLERGKPHERAVAIGVLGDARARDAAPLIAHELLGDRPLVREWAKRALESILGKCDVDLTQDDATIAGQAGLCGGATIAPPAGAPRDEDPED
jgi:predicted CXXCH cytochrome family protein